MTDYPFEVIIALLAAALGFCTSASKSGGSSEKIVASVLFERDFRLWCPKLIRSYHFKNSLIAGPLWHTFVSSSEVYERSSIEGVEDSYDGRYDSDGAEKSL